MSANVAGLQRRGRPTNRLRNSSGPEHQLMIRAAPVHSGNRVAGFSLVELLIIIVIVGIITAIAIATGRATATQQAETAAVRAVQQSVWQGATAASARGRETELVVTGRIIEVREVVSGALVRRDELPEGVVTNLPRLVFTPPGRVSAASLAALPDPVFIRMSTGQFNVQISAIGEVLLESQQ